MSHIDRYHVVRMAGPTAPATNVAPPAGSQMSPQLGARM